MAAAWPQLQQRRVSALVSAVHESVVRPDLTSGVPLKRTRTRCEAVAVAGWVVDRVWLGVLRGASVGRTGQRRRRRRRRRPGSRVGGDGGGAGAVAGLLEGERAAEMAAVMRSWGGDALEGGALAEEEDSDELGDCESGQDDGFESVIRVRTAARLLAAQLDTLEDDALLQAFCAAICELFGDGIHNEYIQAILEANVVPKIVRILEPLLDGCSEEEEEEEDAEEPTDRSGRQTGQLAGGGAGDAQPPRAPARSRQASGTGGSVQLAPGPSTVDGAASGGPASHRQYRLRRRPPDAGHHRLSERVAHPQGAAGVAGAQHSQRVLLDRVQHHRVGAPGGRRGGRGHFIAHRRAAWSERRRLLRGRRVGDVQRERVRGRALHAGAGAVRCGVGAQRTPDVHA
eukprot:ctg_2753.g549